MSYFVLPRLSFIYYLNVNFLQINYFGRGKESCFSAIVV